MNTFYTCTLNALKVLQKSKVNKMRSITLAIVAAFAAASRLTALEAKLDNTAVQPYDTKPVKTVQSLVCPESAELDCRCSLPCEGYINYVPDKLLQIDAISCCDQTAAATERCNTQ